MTITLTASTSTSTSSTPYTAPFPHFDSRRSPAFDLFSRTPRENAHSPASSTDRNASAEPAQVEFEPNSAWPTIASAFNDESDKVQFEFARAWSPVDDVGLIPSAWLVPAPSPESDPDAIAPDCPVWAPGPPPYAKTVMTSGKNESESDPIIDTMSAFIELECTPKMQMKSVSEAMTAIEEALKIKENPMVAIRDAEYRERELMRTRRRAVDCNSRRSHPDVNYGDADEEDVKPSRLSRMSKVAHWIVRNDIGKALVVRANWLGKVG